jgi:hypothetical protein
LADDKVVFHWTIPAKKKKKEKKLISRLCEDCSTDGRTGEAIREQPITKYCVAGQNKEIQVLRRGMAERGPFWIGLAE